MLELGLAPFLAFAEVSSQRPAFFAFSANYFGIKTFHKIDLQLLWNDNVYEKGAPRQRGGAQKATHSMRFCDLTKLGPVHGGCKLTLIE